MKVPLLDLKAQLSPIRDNLAEAILEVLDSTNYIMGTKVEELEKEISKYTGSPFAIGVSSGTDALLVALMALEVGHDDLVITTPYSFFATAGAVARLGATPVFVDIDRDSFGLDPEALDDWLIKNPDKINKVKALIVVHLYGQCCDMEPIQNISKKYNIPVIEDAAQALGATYPIKSTSVTMNAGAIADIGCYSFFPSKNLGCLGDGGMVVCNDEALANKIKLLRNHGAKPKYYHKLIGGNFRLDTIQAAVLLVKLPHLQKWNQARQENAHFYTESLLNLPIRTPKICYSASNHIFNQYVITVDSGKRDQLKEYLAKNEIGTEIYYPVSFHEQECFKYLDYKLGDLPNSEFAARNTLALPIYPELNSEQKNHVVKTIRAFYEK